MSKRLSEIEREIERIEIFIEKYSLHRMFGKVQDLRRKRLALQEEKESILRIMSMGCSITVGDHDDFIDLVDILLRARYKLNISAGIFNNSEEIANYTIKFSK